MSHSTLCHINHSTLKYIVTHVFFPLQLPIGDDHSIANDRALAKAVASAARLYQDNLDGPEASEWYIITGILNNLQASVQSESLDGSRTMSQLRSMGVGDVRAYLIRAQNVAVVFRKHEDVSVVESFELSPKAEDVMGSQGKLVCSYPGPAVEIPTATLCDEGFLSELVNFLVRMNNDVLDAAPTVTKAHSTVFETRDTTHPRYITELLTGILRAVGRPSDTLRLNKRVGDDVVWNNSKLPWRRSSLWLLLRVVLQTSLYRSTAEHRTYKAFMLFFMCCLAKESVCADLPNDLLYAMSSKMSRRLRKLGSFVSDRLSHLVLQTCTSLRSTLEERWKKVQEAQRASPLWTPSQLDLSRDVQLSLLNSRDHIRTSLSNRITNSSDVHFDMKHHPRCSLDNFLSANGTFFKKAYRSEPHVTLYDVERAVEQGIDTWVDQVTNTEKACVQLETLATKYSSGAQQTYGKNPELLSVMFLTMIELWIALDKIVIKETSMLSDYSPEVPTSLLEDLLFCRKASLGRLRSAYQYISGRHSSSKSGWSVFSATINENSFAVRSYRGSPHLQLLKARIEREAEDEVCRKVAELERANACHAELERMAAGVDHNFAIDLHGREYHAVQMCNKCSYERELRSMQIDIHEWPLPAQRLHAEAVVFELDCPISFNMWRTATFHLLVDLCTPSARSSSPYIQLSQYSALRPYFVQHSNSRVSLASDAKPFVRTHYSKQAIPSTQERVCLNNGLTFYGFDSHSKSHVSKALGQADISKYCVYELQAGPYRNLQKYANTTLHTSNEVIGSQADCHKDLSIHEFIAFGHVRSGSALQWLSILRELRSRSLSFDRPEVHFLLAQAVSQVGPLVNAEWAWHEELKEPSFCYALLEELENLLRNVEANWLEAATLDTISMLLRRLLASDPDQAISRKALVLLRTSRRKVFSWIQELSTKLTATPENGEFGGYLRDVAIICRSMFDVDLAMVPEVLHVAEDVKVFLSSAILINRHTPPDVSSLSAYSRILLDRNRRLSLALENVVSDIIEAGGSRYQGVDLAVAWVWPDYRPGSKWSPLRNPNSRWLSCKTAPTANQSSQVVHLNLLDGQLLVQGKQFGRLPSEIHGHPLYKLIFGKQTLEVMPSDVPGMDYSTRGRISGHQVYLSLRNKSDLVIRAMAMRTSEIIELIPAEKLKGDLPEMFVGSHIHWLNLSTSTMEIRPYESLWESSPENWRIICTPERYHMRKGEEFLVDIRSRSWEMISSLLRPLETHNNLIVALSRATSSSSRLSVILPRYGFSFYVDEDGDLQSHDIRGMVYDEDQSMGTLFGLVNRLVLRPKLRNSNANELIPRCVLIPEGKVSFRTKGHHVSIEIDTHGPALQRVTYQTYRINTDLGCLSGNASLTNRLFCAYLHALTSSCGTDPLTGRSGTEEALSLLRSASCWSIMRCGSRDAELLRSIASMYPSRTWYPMHLKHMQKVEWLDLPVGSQHHGLYVVSKAIKEHYERVELFREGQSDTEFTAFKDFPYHNNHLLERSARRTAYLFPPDTSEPSSQPNLDVRYPARDMLKDSPAEQRACLAATVVHHRIAGSKTNRDIVSNLLKSWKGIVPGMATLSLRYDRSWLSPTVPSIWLEAYNLLRKGGEEKWFQLLFSLPSMAYASRKLCHLVPVFVAFAADAQFRAEDPPHYNNYDLSEGYYPSLDTLSAYVFGCAQAFASSPESSEPAESGESFMDLRKRRRQLYDKRLKLDTKETANQLLEAWPCETPPECSLDPRLYNVVLLRRKAQNYFASCYRNLKLKEHVTRIQTILNNVHSHSSPIPPPRYSFEPSAVVPPRISWSVTIDQLFSRHPPSFPARCTLPSLATNIEETSGIETAPLHQLITVTETSAANSFQRQYASALRTSADCFVGQRLSESQGTVKLPTARTLERYYAKCSASYSEGLERLKECLGPKSWSEHALQQSGQWPRITVHALFRCLASNSPTVAPENWKACLVKFALLALNLQRSRRLLQLRLKNHPEELRKELENEGCNAWRPKVHPDWLLIQLQGNFLVRRVQAQVANEMTAPRSGSNTAMQLNMGEGKSSVIVPIVVANLADGDQLVRVIVPKALTTQMFYLLADRLGGLVNRRIYFLPFSRSFQVDHQKVAALHAIVSECMRERGALIVQPEYILSLRLVSVEKQLPQGKDVQLAHGLLNLQSWLHSHSRDILDESDEILHVRYQLVYTIGLQQPMEGSPERWTTTQQVLGLVKKHAPSLQELFPLAIEYGSGPSGSFPCLRILHADAGQLLISRIAQDIMNDLIPNFSFGQHRPGLRDAIRNFISSERVHPANTQMVREYATQAPLWRGLLLLRGLLAMGILLYVFRERRWRVDYGLAPTRTMLAVPYRAKDVPAQRAEFGHPDIAIILTCLSYYYGGLTEEQVKLSFEMLLRQDNPALDYDLWIRDCPGVPAHLQTLTGVNIKSSEQWNTLLVPLFSRNRATIDFYLSGVVFPKEAKVFPSKLSCSGWDLAEKKERLLTGFSGTNDGQYLLPLHIAQRDPDHQRGTNAKVLSYLLQPENNYYICMARGNGERRTAHEFLQILVAQKPEIRVLLDVGAQMLELQNHELAEVWLCINPNASAAIYFSEDDELMVRTRDGRTQSFLSSPFAQQLDQCVVYLDDAHTRGTDIKFPSGFRAAVTLGPKVTKDRLAQGCMRMRQLGHGHSIMFFAPLEVDRCIRLVAGKGNGSSGSIETKDILHWAIRETCQEIQHWAPHWAQQGMDHTSRHATWAGFRKAQLSAQQLSDEWLQPEAKKLEELYGPRDTSTISFPSAPEIRQRCVELGILSLRDVGMDEEQEREVEREVLRERERQVERPPRVKAASHSIHPDVIALVKTGIVPAKTKVFLPAFVTLDATSAATKEVHIWSRFVLATADFQKTVSSSGKLDEYLRPVQWVVSAKMDGNEVLVILSPYEVNHLMPYLRSSKNAHLHLYTPRVNRFMKPCDDLALYSIPKVSTNRLPSRLLMDQLNVFAGQLYLKDYETYIRLCRFLCLYTKDLQDEDSIDVACDGFILPMTRPMCLLTLGDTFQSSPMNCVRTLLSLRRKGMRFAPTHMGQLVNGRLLSETDFDEFDREENELGVA